MTQSPHASPVMERRPIPTNLFTDPHLQQGLAKMKHEQELQHQLLIQHYRQQQQQLAQEHEKQIQDHIKVLLIYWLGLYTLSSWGGSVWLVWGRSWVWALLTTQT